MHSEEFSLTRFAIMEDYPSKFCKGYMHKRMVGFLCPACTAPVKTPEMSHGTKGECPCGVSWAIWGNTVTISKELP